MLRLALTTALMIFCTSALATPVSRHSAVRVPGTSYLTYLPSYRHPMQEVKPGPVLADTTSAEGAAVSWGQPLPDATVWENYDVMLERFKKVRDVRWMKTVDMPDFARRISWLYPDDGCFARAGLEIFNFGQWLIALPKKVFAFGNLVVKTANAPGGEVSWWYHVAPIVEVAKQKYVLDPALDPLQPMKLEAWIGAMSADPSSLQVAICGSGSYSPDDVCQKDSDGVESLAFADQNSFLYSEWSRLIELKRAPEKELGDNPPWN